LPPRRLHRPGDDRYSIWGDLTELKNQQAIGASTSEPKITVKLVVTDWDTYWDKLQTGLAGGAAPDLRWTGLFPDYAADVLLD
jgi:ABC-type glycerol-3-phosphate transport system substrate-binding protein